MTDTPACNWSSCGTAEGLRLYACGHRCPSHTPAALAGKPEPDELLRIGRENVARRAAEKTAN